MPGPALEQSLSRSGNFALIFFTGAFLFCAKDQARAAFVNFETAPLHPVTLSPDGRTLGVCNLADGRVELFDVAFGVPVPVGSVPVGIDPVSLRFRTTNELWVVNHISRSISVVDVARRLVVETLNTLDGPADIIFPAMPRRAFVSCAKENTVQVIDTVTRQVVTNLVIDGERPKAMALSPDGNTLYVAIFESGNGSTILVGTLPDTRKVLKDPRGPYLGQFPVPNDAAGFHPPINTNLFGAESLLPDSLIVKKNAAGRWMDDNQGDWSEFISGTNAGLSGRIGGWDLPDHDLAVIDTGTLEVRYVRGLMNICMDVAVNPASGRIAVIGSDATNERRFEPNVRGTFLRVNLALVEPDTLAKTILDLNPHLDYSTPSAPATMRDLSIGDPRGIVWNNAGTRGYVTGMGSRNLIVIDGHGQRIGSAPVELGEGPSGLALDEPRQRLYVLNRFSASLSVIDTATLNVVTNLPFFDPTPPAIKIGRKHFYDTRRNSGLGHVSCGSCHVDARVDRLAWDLGNPAGELLQLPGSGLAEHPMKGPMVTITLQDIIVPAAFTDLMPLHWRGDRRGIEDFNITFTALLARDTQLTTNEMQEFKDFLATICFPPSRFRNLDNSTPTNMPLPGMFGVDANGFPDSTTPLPNGNASVGENRFVEHGLHGIFPFTQGQDTCTTCHKYRSGRGVEGDFIHVGREDERVFRTAQLRSLSEKLGMDLRGTNSRTGFGFRFDGRAATLTDFLVDIFRMTNNQDIADTTAFLLSFPGTEFAYFLFDDSQDSHADVGQQSTLRAAQVPTFVLPILDPTGSSVPPPDLVARGVRDGLNRAWYSHAQEGRVFQSDRNGEQITLEALLALAAPDAPLTLTVVPWESGYRAVDRDGDGAFDRTELDVGFDPADPLSHPPPSPVLSIERSGNSIILSWPATSPGFTLYAAGSLASPVDWQRSNAVVSQSNGQFRVAIVGAGPQFFRLQWP